MRYADAVAALIEGGWTKTHYPRWGDARAHTYDVSRIKIGYALHTGRGGSWSRNAVSADVWVSTPDEKGAQAAVVLLYDADGKAVRQMGLQRGWKPHTLTNDEIARKARAHSPQGREAARLASIESARQRAERNVEITETRQRLARLADDAREMLEEQGYDPTIIQVTDRGKVIIDLEDFLSILRSDAGG